MTVQYLLDERAPYRDLTLLHHEWP
ncbi:uncharacterized protein METZ01_LOCUS489816, partial [marine metagenome]